MVHDDLSLPGSRFAGASCRLSEFHTVRLPPFDWQAKEVYACVKICYYISHKLFMAAYAIYPIIFLAIGFIAWLSSRELRTSAEHIRKEEGVLKNERDILEERIALRTEALLAAEQGRLAELERTVQFGELSKGLFHDLMNPLSALSLSVEELDRSKNASPEVKNMLDRSLEISKRMKSYMESVKRCLERPGISPPVATSNVLHEIEIARDILGYKARMAKVKITIDCPKGVLIKAHPVRIHQIFLNLMSNAIDACAEKEAEKELSVHVSEENGIKIEIKDTGCGMNEERLKNLFSTPSTSKKNGTGIGLGTVKKIIEELHGAIEVQSELNVGTTFTIALPN